MFSNVTLFAKSPGKNARNEQIIISSVFMRLACLVNS
jgi:hypothetical protein